jgi:hypothetical protein
VDDDSLVVMATSVIIDGRVSITHCLLELRVEPKRLALGLTQQCPSLRIFKLLAEFELDWKENEHNIIQ